MGVCAIWGPPQSGKTTLAIDLAFALSMQDRSVCLISPEPYSEAAARLEIPIGESQGLFAAARKRGALQQAVCEVSDLLYVLAVPTGTDAFGEDLSEESAKSIVDEAGELFDIVLVDCPSHTGSVLAAWAISRADTVLMTTGASTSALLWDKAFHRAVAAVGEKAVYICAEISDSYDYHSLKKALSLSSAMRVPFFPEARLHQAVRRTLYNGQGKSGREYDYHIDAICDVLCEEDDEDGDSLGNGGYDYFDEEEGEEE